MMVRGLGRKAQANQSLHVWHGGCIANVLHLDAGMPLAAGWLAAISIVSQCSGVLRCVHSHASAT